MAAFPESFQMQVVQHMAAFDEKGERRLAAAAAAVEAAAVVDMTVQLAV